MLGLKQRRILFGLVKDSRLRDHDSTPSAVFVWQTVDDFDRCIHVIIRRPQVAYNFKWRLRMSPVDSSTKASASRRGVFLTVMAMLFVILAASDFTKVFQHSRADHLGLVILGHRFVRPAANLVLGPLFGAFLLLYANGIWTMRRWVIPLSLLYAFYVPVNEVLFWSLHQLAPPTVGFIVFYLFLSLTGSIGTALYLAYHQDQLQ